MSAGRESLFAEATAWARRLDRVLADAPDGIEVLVTHRAALVCVKGSHAKAMEADGVTGENDEIEAGTITEVRQGPLRPYGESL